MSRVSKDDYYLDIAETVAERSTCLKRKYGAIIVKNDSIIATGFNGAPRGIKDCLECKECNRLNSDRGMDYSNCLSVHAEQNAIISASRDNMIDSTLYLVGYTEEYSTVKDNTYLNLPENLKPVKIKHNKKYVENAEPCSLCKRLIINSGIKYVIVRDINSPYMRTFNPKLWTRDDIIGGY